MRTRAPSLSYESVSHPSKHVVRYSYRGMSLRDKTPVHSAHLCTIQEIVQFLSAFTDTDDCNALMLGSGAQCHANPDAKHAHREHHPQVDPTCLLVQPSLYPSGPAFYPLSSQVYLRRRRGGSCRRASSIGPRRAWTLVRTALSRRRAPIEAAKPGSLAF